MKKVKRLLPVLVAIVAIFTISMLAACNKTDKETLQSIEITAEPYRSEFLLNEEFSAAGIEVTAHFSNSDKVLESEELTVDSSAYNSAKEGTYEIVISYTYGTVTKQTSYNVQVSETIYEGIYIGIEEGYNTNAQYFDLSKVVVKAVDSNGTVIDERLDSSEYTLKVYFGATELSQESIVENTAILSQTGKYQIWAFKDSSIDGYVLSNFIIIVRS